MVVVGMVAEMVCSGRDDGSGRDGGRDGMQWQGWYGGMVVG